MSVKTYNVKLTVAEIDQLVAYCQHWENADDGGWYYGQRKQFEDRHMRIREKLAQVLGNTSRGHIP